MMSLIHDLSVFPPFPSLDSPVVFWLRFSGNYAAATQHMPRQGRGRRSWKVPWWWDDGGMMLEVEEVVEEVVQQLRVLTVLMILILIFRIPDN
jgi:hypothetical protein